MKTDSGDEKGQGSQVANLAHVGCVVWKSESRWDVVGYDILGICDVEKM